MFYNYSLFGWVIVISIFILFNMNAFLNLSAKYTRVPFSRDKIMEGETHIIYNVFLMAIAWSPFWVTLLF